jgi:hypothetical protein
MTYASSPKLRAPFALAAVAMTALVLGLTVVAPAKLDSGFADLRLVATAPAEVALHCACVDAQAVRSAQLVSGAGADSKCRLES